jgi:hypothetical protein
MTQRFVFFSVAIVLLATPFALADGRGHGGYVAGDIHNHTTYSDGSTSSLTLIDMSVNEFGLDFFCQSGHEHCSVAIIGDQFKKRKGKRNALGLSEFEYRFDMEDNDTSSGYGWTGKIPNPPKDAPGAGVEGHAKAVAACTWAQWNHPFDSYVSSRAIIASPATQTRHSPEFKCKMPSRRSFTI